MTDILPLVAGNWKMNGLKGSVLEIEALKKAVLDSDFTPKASIMVCPPTTLLMAFAHILSNTPILLGGQDCHTEIAGAHTGDISAEMLTDAGAKAVIVGHSERRTNHGERDGDVYMKSLAAHRAGLTAIICIGETENERRAGTTLDVIARQLNGSVPSNTKHENTVIAYEPVWAIGTGLTPTTEDVAEVHQFIRKELSDIIGDEAAASIRILYGGSVKPSNAKELMSVENVNGALVGGASLKATDFMGIISAYN